MILWNPSVTRIQFQDKQKQDEINRILQHELSFVCNKAERPNYDWSLENDDYWDGIARLVRITPTEAIFPSGLIYRALAILEANKLASKEDIEIGWDENNLPRLTRTLTIPALRSHQEPIPDIMIDYVRAGREASPRTGKTYEAYATIAKLGLRSLFIVSRREWLDQAYEKFCELAGSNSDMIGKYGGGKRNPSEITICMDASLDKHLRNGSIEASKLVQRTGCVVFDEADMTAGTSRAAIIDGACRNAPYRFGFSATLSSNRTDGASMLVEAITGPIVATTSAEEALEEGYHAPGTALFIRLPRIIASFAGSYQSQYDSYLIHNPYRTLATVYLAQWAITKKRKPLIDRNWTIVILVSQIEQAREIARYIPSAHIAIGQTPTKERKEIMRKIKSGEIRCVITTLYHRAVDIVDLDMCINAGGGDSEARFIQGKYRAKTIGEEDKHAYYIDFLDQVSIGWVGDDISPLEKHANHRMALTRKDKSWTVNVKDLHKLDGFMPFFRQAYPNGLPEVPMLDVDDPFVKEMGE